MKWYTEPFLPAMQRQVEPGLGFITPPTRPKHTRGDQSIVMSGESLDSIHDESKTQSRRLAHHAEHLVELGEEHVLSRAPYRPGDTCWVREAFQLAPDGLTVLYKADYALDDGRWRDKASGRLAPGPWKSPRFMPRVHSRTELRIDATGLQLVQEINEADCIAEGIRRLVGGWVCKAAPDTESAHDWHLDAQGAFCQRWDDLHARAGHGWDTNPLVLALRFHVTKRRS